MTHAYGVRRLTLPGNYLYEWEEQENGRGCGLWWDGTGKGPIWRVNGFRLQGKEASLEGGFDGLTDSRGLDMPNGRARWGWHKVEDGKDAYYQVFCKAVSGPSLFLMTITFFEEGQRAGVYGLLGANGAGKTTLMRMICGILKQTSGTVTCDGLTVSSEEYRAQLG